MLADDMIRNSLRGYATYILSENKVQVERLENIFHQIGRGRPPCGRSPLRCTRGSWTTT